MYYAVTDKTGWRFLFYCVFLFVFLFPFSSASGQTSLDEVKLKEMPEGWIVASEFPVPQEKVGQFEVKFAAVIDEMFNQFLAVNNGEQGRIQINYVLCHSVQDTAYVLRQMVEMVGQWNVVLQKDTVVIEIIATKRQLQKEVIAMLNVSNLQKRKLSSATLPGNWKFVREISMAGGELQGFSEKITVPVTEVVNQFFLVDRKRVQVNYIACQSDSDAEQAYARLNDMTGKVNTILKKDSIVLEVIATTAESRDKIVKELEKI